MEKKQDKRKKKTVGRCEDCVYYDYDEFSEDYACQMSLDEDEMEHFLRGTFDHCPYYKFYDEYKSVQKQN